jgi:hypothetical protein
VEGVLDCKIWGNKIIGLVCYFTQVDTGVPFCLSVFQARATGQYVLQGSTLDFRQAPTGVRYRLKVTKNRKDHPFLKEAQLV